MNEGLGQFQHLLVEWLKGTHLLPSKNLHIDLIINPHAGAFRHRRRTRGLVEGLQRAAKENPFRELAGREVRVTTFYTSYPGHEKAILTHLQRSDPLLTDDERLVVIAGGDGTSRGALISALALPPETRAKLLFFRLPLGTGNDAAETRDWDEALDLLSGRGYLTATPQALPVIEIELPRQGSHFSFNIASVGLDAFVAHMTNQLKAWLPGNSYSLMVDVAALFYEAFVQVVPSRLELTFRGQPVLTWDKAFLLAALGASGHRTYGSGKKVLPDHDNFCLAGRKNLFTKLTYREPFYRGTHRGLDGISLAQGDRLSVTSPVRLPLQMDGEVLWVEPDSYPVVFQIADRGLRALRPSSRL